MSSALRRSFAGFVLMTAAALAQVPAEASARVPVGDPFREQARVSQVQRHGITWRFDRECVVGAFVNGDPWVVGPVAVVAIDPAAAVIDGRVLHGSMLDPDASTMQQGYDTALFGDATGERYDAARNVAVAVSAARPLALSPGHSLVSVKSRADWKLIPQLETAAVLTCVGEAPAPDAFRPPYVKGDKTVRFREVDLDYSVLRRVPATLDAPSLEVTARAFERLWLDHFPGWPVRYSHPVENMPDYGRDMAALVGTGALLLQTDVPNEQKRDLFVRLVQIGIDLHAALRGGCRWQGIGGHGGGRKLPILIAGLALHDEPMLAIGRDFVSAVRRDGPGAFFAEDGQTFIVTETSPGVWNHGFGGYGRDHDGLPEWGFSHSDHPNDDQAAWDKDPYRRCCSANGWVGEALAARMMGLVEAWHHPPFFAYMDRYMQVKHEEGWHRAWAPWQATMWDAYRSNY